ncbi:MmcQ-like protein [Hymenobacter sedentarius]|uniref:MmcQ-like protein n=1 Tax=Hymenobacter sedentarius TaxID=1411621 RepID=A0A0U3T093_9BACT|nr:MULTISPECIES: MmcQ/YjbR family DNA-binding protein [Hymenobacter]ALW86259.1 MmcQ-like protein [Hymenobacter sedentarius]MCC3153060.1 MmcQ/YjbR family DNA-binding protein [Hymenobacter sp. BT770]MDO3415027.1 MmcQ/YjbR family DNA-binding protein [Hymenobacter sp. BT770]
MNIEDFRDYCLAKPGVTDGTPFGPETLVFKVGGKMFALTDIDTFGSINLKCDPERAVELREAHDYVLPGYHMSKTHWNTVLIGTGIPERQLRELIDHSYDLVLASLPKATRAMLAQ